MTLPMTERELAEATRALNDWFASQTDIPTNCRAPIACCWLASEIVAQGNTPERLDTGRRLIRGILDGYITYFSDIAKRYGVHR